MNTKVSVYGALYENQPGIWKTKPADHYTCSWMRTKSKYYKHFKMTVYQASIMGKESKITQYLTKSPCYYFFRKCIPRELPKS